MAKHIFDCIDAHTCGNPVRLVRSGAPELIGENMMDKREHFIKDYYWILKSLMFEPRGHDLMSGGFLYQPKSDEFDVGILFIETSGCLPMCGHGTIGLVTIMIEEKLVIPKNKDMVILETPAGRVDAYFSVKNGKVSNVKIVNVPSFLYKTNIQINSSHIGKIALDVAYGGNFYAIIDIQKNFSGIDSYSAADLATFSREIRKKINESHTFEHPLDPRIKGCTHILWAGSTIDQNATARNAVFYGEKAIDRSPCGTGTSARMAQWFTNKKLSIDDNFTHESIIGSQFIGRIESTTEVDSYKAIVPSIEGWAKVYGYNQIIVDTNDDPYAHGFQVV